MRKERTYDVLSIQREESGNGTKKYSGKATSPSTQKEKEEKNVSCVWLSGCCLHIEGRLNEEPRIHRKHRDKNKAKQNKRNTRERRHGIISKPNARRIQILSRHLFVASQQGRANQHAAACFELSSSWSFPSRLGIPLHAVVQPWLSLQQFISP